MSASETGRHGAFAMHFAGICLLRQVFRISGLAALALAIQSLGLSRAGAETVSVGITADASLIQTAPDSALGGATFFNAGTTAGGSLNRALLYFDLTGLVPENAQITSVSLSMDVVRQPAANPVSSLFSLRRVFASWGEGRTAEEDMDKPGKGGPAQIGDATWNHRFYADTPWFVPGGAVGMDFSAEISSTAEVYGQGDLVMFNNTPQMLSDVQFWLEHPELNFGWMLKTEAETQVRTARSFASRESGSGPTLSIDFMVVPEPAMLWFATLALVGLWSAQRR